MKKWMSRKLLSQLMRFFIVGIIAATVHFSVVVIIVQSFVINPLLANIVGFCFGVQISYVGHRYVTFKGTTKAHHQALPKLLILQIINFILNEYLFFILLAQGLPYPIALFIVLAVMPLITFTISKKFIF